MSPRVLLAAALLSLVAACALRGPMGVEQHRWWSGLGPVLPHDTFPADCSICHQGFGWGDLVDDFSFDHEAETGVRLDGAHAFAQCILCHNDRGHVSVFQARGCVGCHEDVHQGDLGQTCEDCHGQETWFAREDSAQLAQHDHSRFPLIGTHALTACNRCHLGANVGNFLPADPACESCHQDDLARTTNHVGLGWVDRCDRCHIPTFWEQAEVD